MSSIVPELPCKPGDQKIEVFKKEWAIERKISKRFVGHLTTTEGILKNQIFEELMKKILGAIDLYANSEMVADHATNTIGDNEAFMVKIRLGVLDTITYVWDCDCYGKWKEPPRIIRRRYVDSIWTEEPGP